VPTLARGNSQRLAANQAATMSKNGSTSFMQV